MIAGIEPALDSMEELSCQIRRHHMMFRMVPAVRIGLTASSMSRKRSTIELRGHRTCRNFTELFDAKRVLHSRVIKLHA